MKTVNQKRTIAFVNTVPFPCGGAEKAIMDIASYVLQCNYEVFLFTPQYQKSLLSDEERKIPLKVVELPSKDVQSKENAQFIIRQIRENKIQILLPVEKLKHIHSIKKQSHCAYVCCLHGEPFWEIKLKISNALWRRKKNLFSWLEWIFLSYPKYIIFRTHRRSVIRNYYNHYLLSDKFTVLCEPYKETLIRKLRLDSNENKLCVLYNTVRKVSSVDYNKKNNILYVGRMSYSDKRVDRLIRIWEKIYERLLDWELILVGDGTDRIRLEGLAKGLARVHFVGFRIDVSEFYRDASVLCLVSETEGWSLCLTEAQAHGVVPVAFACSDGVKEILSPSGVNGFLIPPFDLEAYAQILLKICNDKALLNTMRSNVLQKAAVYDMEHIGPKWLALLDELYAR